jgi:hypothetical protein
MHWLLSQAESLWGFILAHKDAITSIVTAAATVALAVLTFVLARATKAMAVAASSSNVIVSLEPNQWSLMHIDMIVQNTGNDAAFDVSVLVSPTLENASVRDGLPFPFDKISVLRPGQSMSCFINEFAYFDGKVFDIEVRWKRKPNSRKIEKNFYQIDLANLGAVSRLGAFSPNVQIAEQIKKLRDDWKPVAGGQRRFKVDSYSQEDREQEAAERQALFEQQREEREKRQASRAKSSKE